MPGRGAGPVQPHRGLVDGQSDHDGAGLPRAGHGVVQPLGRPGPDLPWRSRHQYASRCYTDLLAGHGMSRRSNCWDKACSETLFGSLKV
jgi:hypothetical protein